MEIGDRTVSPRISIWCVPQLLYPMSHFDQSFWLRELAKTGLPAAGQKELLTSLTKAVGGREYLFPTEPSQYVRRIRQLLSAAFLPQQGLFGGQALGTGTGSPFPMPVLGIVTPGVFPPGWLAPTD